MQHAVVSCRNEVEAAVHWHDGLGALHATCSAVCVGQTKAAYLLLKCGNELRSSMGSAAAAAPDRTDEALKERRWHR